MFLSHMVFSVNSSSSMLLVFCLTFILKNEIDLSHWGESVLFMSGGILVSILYILLWLGHHVYEFMRMKLQVLRFRNDINYSKPG